MSELLTAAQMRAIERAAIESGQVTGLELMERAGRGVVEAVFEEWPELAKGSFQAVVLCGPGNNGGDGFVVARLLKEWGWEVEVFLYGDAEKLPPDAKANYERWGEMGLVAPFSDYGGKSWSCDLLIDALFGTGLKRGLLEFGDLFWNMEDMVDCFPIEFGHRSGRPAIVAVDIPSGICSDSGNDFPHEESWYRYAACAHLTVSFHRAKCGHHLANGPAQTGKLVIKDIQLEKTHAELKWIEQKIEGSLRPPGGGEAPARGGGRGLPGVPPGDAAWKIARNSVVRLFDGLHVSWIGKNTENHKYTHGHALILSGGAGKTGAARLAARGALRIGAGLVTIGVPPSAQMEVAGQITALMLTRVEGGEGLAAVLEDARLNALCLGPGLGVDLARDLVPVALAAGRATVLDADALSAFADDPQVLFGMLHHGCVLTPHGGEFARLFPDIAEKLNAKPCKGPAYSKVDATRDAAKRAGCTVLFKGPDTVIADQTGRASINSAHYDRAAPWLATAGSGDVLAGFITGLLARGLGPMQAAETGAWLHVECARAFGPGLIAEDLPEILPQVFRDLGL